MNKSISNSDTVKQLTRIAKEVREWIESEFGMSDCKCAIASYEIFKRCKQEGIRVRFCLSYFHAFIKHNEIIIDVTADQFEGHLRSQHPILVGALPDLPNITSYAGDSIWEEIESATTKRGIRKLLNDWPSDQQPAFVNSTKL